MAFPGPLGSETIRLPGDVRFPTQSGEPSVLGVYFLKCPKWCRSTKVDPDPERGDIPLMFSGQLEVLIDLPFLNHVLDVAADEICIRKW
jgi:hypothetical protein